MTHEVDEEHLRVEQAVALAPLPSSARSDIVAQTHGVDAAPCVVARSHIFVERIGNFITTNRVLAVRGGIDQTR